MAKASFNKKALYQQKITLKFEEEIREMPDLELSFVRC
jgi:hypothetical protein